MIAVVLLPEDQIFLGSNGYLCSHRRRFWKDPKTVQIKELPWCCFNAVFQPFQRVFPIPWCPPRHKLCSCIRGSVLALVDHPEDDPTSTSLHSHTHTTKLKSISSFEDIVLKRTAYHQSRWICLASLNP